VASEASVLWHPRDAIITLLAGQLLLGKLETEAGWYAAETQLHASLTPGGEVGRRGRAAGGERQGSEEDSPHLARYP